MKCPVCSAELPPTAKFCGSCGTTLSSPPPPTDFSNPPSNPSGPHYGNPSPPSYGSFSPPSPNFGTGTGEKKYKALRTIANIYKIMAFVVGGLLAIAALITMASGAASSTSSFGGPTALFGGFLFGVIMLVYAGFAFVFLYGMGEFIYLFLDIEENTRKTSEMLSRR